MSQHQVNQGTALHHLLHSSTRLSTFTSYQHLTISVNPISPIAYGSKVRWYRFVNGGPDSCTNKYHLLSAPLFSSLNGHRHYCYLSVDQQPKQLDTSTSGCTCMSIFALIECKCSVSQGLEVCQYLNACQVLEKEQAWLWEQTCDFMLREVVYCSVSHQVYCPVSCWVSGYCSVSA